MHLPQAAQQCTSCYMYCMSRGPNSGGVPPVPPHHLHECGPQRTQPRAVTLPLPRPALGPRFGSLPSQQQSSKIGHQHSGLSSHHGTLRNQAPNPNIVGLPEEKPPPLPPHGPPALPPANLYSTQVPGHRTENNHFTKVPLSQQIPLNAHHHTHPSGGPQIPSGCSTTPLQSSEALHYAHMQYHLQGSLPQTKGSHHRQEDPYHNKGSLQLQAHNSPRTLESKKKPSEISSQTLLGHPSGPHSILKKTKPPQPNLQSNIPNLHATDPKQPPHQQHYPNEGHKSDINHHCKGHEILPNGPHHHPTIESHHKSYGSVDHPDGSSHHYSKSSHKHIVSNSQLDSNESSFYLDKSQHSKDAHVSNRSLQHPNELHQRANEPHQHSGGRHQNPSGPQQQSSKSPHQPPNGHYHHPSGLHPSGPRQHPSGPHQHPSGPHQHPSGPHQHPSGAHQHPSGAHQHPGGAHQHPSGPHQHPSGPHQHPSGPHQHPSGPHQHPSGPHQHPSGPHQHPSGPHQHSNGPHQHPSGPHQHPSGPHQHPSGPHQHPSGPHQHPSGPHQHPSGPHQHPSGPHQHPSGPHQHPSGPHQHPSGPHQHPSGPHQHPSGPHQHSSGPHQHPSGPHPHPNGPHQHPSGPHPHPNGPHPHPNGPHQHPNGPHQHPNGPHPHPNGPHPHPNGPHPHPNGPHPHPNGPHPHPNGLHPHPNGLHPHPNGLHPHPNGPKQHPMVSHQHPCDPQQHPTMLHQHSNAVHQQPKGIMVYNKTEIHRQTNDLDVTHGHPIDMSRSLSDDCQSKSVALMNNLNLASGPRKSQENLTRDRLQKERSKSRSSSPQSRTNSLPRSDANKMDVNHHHIHAHGHEHSKCNYSYEMKKSIEMNKSLERVCQVQQNSVLVKSNVPLPPPMPPMFTAPTHDQWRYTCLPHQQLVPPPRLTQNIVLGCPEHGHHHISSTSKIDRPYCGPGQSGRNRGLCMALNKSHSLETGGLLNQSHHHGPNNNHHHLVRRPQAVSQSSGIGNSRHSRGVAVDDCGSRSDRWRRSGAQNAGQAYELSQDLADKRLEMLERRYGGDKARRAATTIQRAYRQHAMQKKFRSITATAKAQEKRLSRRFTVDNPEWIESNGQGHPFDAEQRIRSEFDKLNRNLNATVYGENRRPCRSLSLRDSCKGSSKSDVDNETSLYCHSTSSTSENPSLNTSTDANSYASSRELKYFASEDSGFGGHEPVVNKSGHRCKRQSTKKVPPEVPRRTSSIKSESSGSVESFVSTHRVHHCAPPSLTPPSSHSSHSSDLGSDRGALRRSADNGSLSSVQSSGSDSSLSHSDRGTPISNQEEFATPTSPVWKRKTQQLPCPTDIDDKRLSNISENSEDSCHSISSDGICYASSLGTNTSSRHLSQPSFNSPELKVSEVLRKRQYRVGLNLFNKKPERGVNYLIGRGFLENAPQAVAKFLLTRKGLSKQMIGEYLGNLQNSLNMSVLECFATEIDLSGMQVDVALRKFQTHFRMPGEAQKIERLMQIFAQRYCQCNRDIVAKLKDPETIFVLAFAIIMLNTDLHTASLKPEKRMKIEDFIKNLRGVDEGCDIEREMLEGMYQRIKSQEFRPGHDHVTQVIKVQQTIVGKKPVLALPHRRLVCYCRLYEIPDPNKKERVGLHQREVFLFNDLLVITKIFSKKKNSLTYTFRESFPLAGLAVATKEATHYLYLLEIRQRVDNKVLATLNARNEHDRTKFCEDLRESILEMDEMENLRIEGELERQKANLRASRPNSTAENRDSGVADMELITPGDSKSCTLKPEAPLKRTALSNSLLDIHEAGL